jgi:hypothetical protein
MGNEYNVIKTYQNYKPTKTQMKSLGKVQIQLLVYIELRRNPNINGTYVGYSHFVYWNQVEGDLSGAYNDAIASAQLSFYNDHPQVRAKTGDLELTILQTRYIRWQEKRK